MPVSPSALELFLLPSSIAAWTIFSVNIFVDDPLCMKIMNSAFNDGKDNIIDDDDNEGTKADCRS